ncbi:hypothetical protein [Pseudomonas bohemica]|uniref:hypothetical protein n=1 Tax=Pseudomonas bohemica TaxID=2044872 RepID=UPI000DA6319F|nr:hypothetical protein [Pseudomonas bohemica]
MKARITSLETTLDTLTKLATGAIKFSVCLGSICVIFYALRVGHFPQGLALADGLLFVVAAACFGFIYTAFAGSMLALGMCFSIALRPLFYRAVRAVAKVQGTEIPLRNELARFSWPSIFPAALGGLFIFLLGRRAPAAYVHLPLLAVALYLFYSMARAAGTAYRGQQQTDAATGVPTQGNGAACDDPNEHKFAFLFFSISVFFAALVLGGVTGQLVDGSMRLAQVRVENAVVHIKAPYAALLPNTLLAPDQRSSDGYAVFRNVTILFRGFGTTTTIGFKEAGRSRQLDLPNEDLIIVRESD